MVKDFAQFLTREAAKAGKSSVKNEVQSKMASMASRVKAPMSKVTSLASKAKDIGSKAGGVIMRNIGSNLPKAAGWGGLASAAIGGAAQIINEDRKTRKQSEELNKDEGVDKSFYQASARNRAKVLAEKSGEKESNGLKIDLARRSIKLNAKLSDKQKGELAIARARLKSGKGTATDRKNSEYAKKQYNY